MNELQPIPALGPTVRVDEPKAKSIRRFFILFFLVLAAGSTAAVAANIPAIKYALPVFSLFFMVLTICVVRQCNDAIFNIRHDREMDRHNRIQRNRLRDEQEGRETGPSVPVDLAALRTELTTAVGDLPPAEYTSEGGFSGEAHLDAAATRERPRDDDGMLAAVRMASRPDVQGMIDSTEAEAVMAMASQAVDLACGRARRLADLAQKVQRLVGRYHSAPAAERNEIRRTLRDLYNIISSV